MVASTPIWKDVRSLGRRSSPIPASVDVAVIGGGIVGLTAMAHLVRAGADAVLIEAGQPGAGSSLMGSGVVGWSRAVADLSEIDPRSSGFGELAHALSGAQEWLAAFATDNAVDAGLEIPGAGHVAGPLNPGTLGTVHPGRFIESLVHAILVKGGSVAVDEPLRSVSRHTKGFQLLTSRRKVSATNVILAAGATHGPYPLDDLQKRYRVRRGRSVVIRADPAVLDEIAPRGRTLHTPAASLVLVRRVDPASALMWFPDLGNRSSSLDAASLIDAHWPTLAGSEVTHDWRDDYATTRDGLPRIGRINATWYAGGAADPALGALVGDHVAGLTIGTRGSSPFAEIPHDYALISRLRRRRNLPTE